MNELPPSPYDLGPRDPKPQEGNLVTYIEEADECLRFANKVANAARDKGKDAIIRMWLDSATEWLDKAREELL